MSHALMAAVAGPGRLTATQAQLEEYARLPVRDAVVPFIIATSGAVCRGVVWHDLTDQQVNRLDLYESAFGYQRKEMRVTQGGEIVPVSCYMPPKAVVAGPGDWALQTWEPAHLAPAVLAAQDLFSHRPLPEPGALRRMWPMIDARAWAKHRASAGPAQIRHAAAPDDMRIVASRPPQGSFFRLQSVDVTHRRFDGTRSHLLVREAFLGVDAAIVLPYDPLRDRVVLVEQFRMGPLMRHDPNPWMLEPVAGIVDARETPQDAAHREAQEEAGLTLRHLEPVSAFYASPGASTDFMYGYVGLCDIPQTSPYSGGLASEAEDLRLHPITLDRALALMDSGEIATGPLVLLLNWLARHRTRLRAMS
ncbi:MAG: NUDIX domain-containing protein [Yoonia sp.]|nr:NUDIX domain-containing protein [Yoonia sp.]